MKIVVDLHSHSPYAGASGKADFKKLSYVMKIKGIDVYGSGDILLKKWEDELNGEFDFDKKKSLWILDEGKYLLPQTEIIVTLPYIRDPSKRKLFHVVILFADMEGVNILRRMMAEKGAKLGIGRPFIKFDCAEEMQGFFALFKQKAEAALIPAHVMTPDGILGGKNPVDAVSEIWGGETKLIDALESGLSADPEMLGAAAASLDIPVISSSDAHSAAFNRLGREFTLLEISSLSAEGVLYGIFEKHVLKTAEFPPFEGRYYLTGHRGDRAGHNGREIFYYENAPALCPICGKPFVEGVRDRIKRIFPGRTKTIQDFVYQIPLVEIIAESLKCGAGSKKASELYTKIVGRAGRESDIWFEEECVDFRDIPEDVVRGIRCIKENKFKIKYGFDGQYGKIIF